MASLFQGIIHAGSTFANDEFVLVDIDEEHLQLMHRLGRVLLDIAGCSTRLQMTTDRLDALTGSDYVLTTFRPGGFYSRRWDESIPLKYGVIGNETIGPGGLFMACRSIPVMFEIARDIEQVCPNASVINYTNPTNLVTCALNRYSHIKIIGICDQHVGERLALAKLLGVSSTRIKTNSIGLNHATWITALYLDGKNILSDFSQRIQKGEFHTDDARLSRSLDLCGMYGLFPTYYLQYYYYADTMVDVAIKRGFTRADEILNELPAIWKSYEDTIRERLPRPPLQRGGSDHGEFALDVISALRGGEEKILTVNTVNGNALLDFPIDSIVEGPAVVSREGVKLLSQTPLPKTIVGLLQAINCYEELAVEAAVHGSSTLLVKALVAHPLVRTLSIAQKLADDLLAVHKSYLPQF